MLRRVMAVSAAMFVVMSGLSHAQPSSFADPAELPPPGFKGQQYIDSRGCVFLRAGFGGEVTWVPRVTADRKQLCKAPETAAAAAPAVEAAPAAEVAVPKAAVAATPEAAPAPAPVRQQKVRRVVQAPPAPPPGMRMACPAATPYLEELRGPGGDAKLYCTRGDGTVDGATLPRLINAGKVVGHLSGVTIAPPSDQLPAVPKGYVRAWKDDRLNPNRAKGTEAGMAAQDRVWTRDVPQDTLPAAKGVAVAKAASGHLYVQVGSFAVSANADAAERRLGALGLPAARKAARLNGRAVEVVYAGPFATAAEAAAARSAARQAGFSDAFIPR